MKEKANRKKAVIPGFIEGAANYKRSFMGKGRYVHEANPPTKTLQRQHKAVQPAALTRPRKATNHL
jgi:hypothetical protein